MNFVKFRGGEFLSRIMGTRVRRIDLLTPTFLPAFSSYGDSFIAERLESVLPLIPQSAALVSALDVHLLRDTFAIDGTPILQLLKERVQGKILYCDSGAYEARNRRDIDWSPDLYHSVIQDLRPDIAVAFDRIPDIGDELETSGQFREALAILDEHPTLEGKVVLVHIPPGKNGQIDQLVQTIVDNEKEFDILGIPEKELGVNVVNRCRFLTQLNLELRGRSVEKPLHVFGCNDFDAILLYACAGADIFDGLGWFRNCLSLDPTLVREAGALPLLACQCPFCSGADWGSLDAKEYGLRLSMHNLKVFSDWMGAVQEAIRSGGLAGLLRQRRLDWVARPLFRHLGEV